jgi:hypothetical protein
MPPHRGAWFALPALLGSTPLGLPGYGQGERLTEPTPAPPRVTTATSGTVTDTGGYTATIGGLGPAARGSGGSSDDVTPTWRP